MIAWEVLECKCFGDICTIGIPILVLFNHIWISIFHITMMVTYKKNCSFALYFVSLNLFFIRAFSKHPVYTWDSPMICLKNAWDILEVDRIYLKYTWDIFLISQDIPEIYLRYTWDIPEIYLVNIWDIPGIYLRYSNPNKPISLSS